MEPSDVPPEDDAHNVPTGVRWAQEGDRTAIWLSGEHDLTSAGVIGKALVDGVARSHRDVVIDLTEVAFLDASTLGVLVRGRQLCAGRGRRLALRSPYWLARRVIDVCGLAEMIEVVDPANEPRHEGGGALGTWVPVPASGRDADAPAPPVAAGNEPEGATASS